MNPYERRVVDTAIADFQSGLGSSDLREAVFALLRYRFPPSANYDAGDILQNRATGGLALVVQSRPSNQSLVQVCLPGRGVLPVSPEAYDLMCEATDVSRAVAISFME